MVTSDMKLDAYDKNSYCFLVFLLPDPFSCAKCPHLRESKGKSLVDLRGKEAIKRQLY